eukprot:g31939.t1
MPGGCRISVNRARYRTAAQEKAQEALHGQLRQENYYLTLVKASSERSDEAAQKDRHQLEKDFMGLDRTFPAEHPSIFCQLFPAFLAASPRARPWVHPWEAAAKKGVAGRESPSAISEKAANFKAAVESSKAGIEREHADRQRRLELMETSVAHLEPKEKELLKHEFEALEHRGVVAKFRTARTDRLRTTPNDHFLALFKLLGRHWSTGDLDPIAVLGQGSFGTVFLVQQKEDPTRRDVLSQARNRWFVELFATFQDANHIFMLMEFLPGGDLFKWIETKNRFSASCPTPLAALCGGAAAGAAGRRRRRARAAPVATAQPKVVESAVIFEDLFSKSNRAAKLLSDLPNALPMSALSALTRLLSMHLDQEMPMEDLQELVRQQRKRFGVPVEEQISETWENTSLQRVYEELLMSFLDNPEHNSDELALLVRLKEVLQLDGIVAGNAHRHCAQLLVAKGYGGLEGDEMKLATDKLLFLSERIFASEVPEEAGRYEMGRLCAVLQLSKKEAVQRVREVSIELFGEDKTSGLDQDDAWEFAEQILGRCPVQKNDASSSKFFRVRQELSDRLRVMYNTACKASRNNAQAALASMDEMAP